jgi:hypothetical protein
VSCVRIVGNFYPLNVREQPVQCQVDVKHRRKR